jgi:hypothetical protein
MSTWQDVDQPVLRWVLERSDEPEWYATILRLKLRPEAEAFDEIDDCDLDSIKVDEALIRLEGHGLIAGQRSETVAYSIWSQLRVTADGLIVEQEWPDLDRAASFEGIRVILAKLAQEQADAEDGSALRQAAGALGSLGEESSTWSWNPSAARYRGCERPLDRPCAART